jgi:HlyD family secretion protein
MVQGIILAMQEDIQPVAKHLPEPLSSFDNQVARVSWMAWGALMLMAGVIALVVFWSVVGDIPTRVRGNCIIMHPQGVQDVTADMPGRVSALLVKPGSMVAAGQEIAVLATPDLFERIEAARAQVADLQAQVDTASEETRRSDQLSSDSLAEQRSTLAKNIESDQRRIRILEQQIDTNQRMRADGLITERAAAAALLDLDDARSSLADTRRRLAEVDKRGADFARTSTQRATRVVMQLSDAQRALDALLAQGQSVTHLRSQVGGRVIELKTAAGNLVRRDSPIASIERLDGPAGDLEAVMYVSAEDGKKIQAKDMVEIAPLHGRREEYGVMRARVLSASEYPATPRGLLNTIANPDLMQELAHGAAPYEVRIALNRSSTAAAGAVNPYIWTAAAGTRLPVSSGALCEGEILVRHERPLSLVLPIFRSTVSGG